MSHIVEGQAKDFTGSDDAFEPARPLYDATLAADGEAFATRSQRSSFTLVTGELEEVSVLTDASTEILPERESSGPWDELRAHPLAALFHGNEPGNHVEVTLRAASVEPGERVAVLGVETRSLDHEGYRGGHDVRRTIKATAIATGDAPGALLLARQRGQEEPEAGPTPSTEQAQPLAPRGRELSIMPVMTLLLPAAGALALAAYFVAADAGGESVSPWTSAFLCVAFAAFTLAYVVYGVRMQRFPPWFGPVRATTSLGPAPLRRDGVFLVTWLVAIWGLGGISTAMAFVFFVFPALVFAPPLSGPVAGVMAAGACTLLLARLYLYERPHASALRTLLRADSTLEVSVSRGGLYRRRRVDTQYTVGRKREWWEPFWPLTAQTRTIVPDSEIEAHTADGRSVRIQCRDAFFGTVARTTHYHFVGAVYAEAAGLRAPVTPRSDPKEFASAMLAKLEAAQASGVALGLEDERRQDKDKMVTEEWIAPGSSLLVLARFEDESGELVARSTGPQSLMMFGAPESARSRARRELLEHRVALGAIGLLAFGTLALGLLGPLVWT